jgi:alpha-tubulin suppressor-like RCC1 family protein
MVSICMQCLELTGNHKLLTCDHSICSDCANTLFAVEVEKQQQPYMNGVSRTPTEFIQSHDNTYTKGIASIECPVCHTKTLIPTTSSPDATLRSARLETGGNSHEGELASPVRFPCGGECGRTATVECYKCEVQFCDTCFERVHRVGAMRNHEPIRVSSVQDERYCQRHMGQKLDLFCQDCQRLVCQKCLIYEQDHKGHQYVIVEQYREQCMSDLESVRKELKQKREVVDKSKATVQEVLNSLYTKKSSIEQQINERFAIISQALETRKKQLIQQLADCIAIQSKSLDDQIETLKNTAQQFEEIESLIDVTVKSKPTAFEAAQAKQTAVSLNQSARIDPELCVPRVDINSTSLSLDVDSLRGYISSLGSIIEGQGDGRGNTPVRFSPKTTGIRGVSTPGLTTPKDPLISGGVISMEAEPWEMKLRLPKPGLNDMPNIAEIISANTGLYSNTPSQPIRPVRASTTKTPKSVSWLNHTPSKFVRANTSTRIVTGEVLSFGGNEHGQLGTGSKDDAAVATHVVGLHGQGIVSIAAGDVHTLALSDTGDMFSFGNNDMGQLGTGDNRPYATVQSVNSLLGHKIVKIAAGRYFSLALTDKGELYSWGDNDCGQLGLGDRQDRNLPSLVEGALAGLKIKDICAGASFALCQTVDGEVFGWGSNQMGQLSTGDSDNRLTPIAIDCFKGMELVELVAGGHHCLAVTEDGELMAWGWNRYGQLGLGDDDSRNVAEYVSALRSTKLETVTAGAAHSVALSISGDLYAWGRNNHGQLGLGDRIDRFTPQYLSNIIEKVDRVFCNSSAWHTFVVLKSGTVKSFGWNHKAQLGVKTKEEDGEVQTVRSLQGKKIISITNGGYHSLVVTEH